MPLICPHQLDHKTDLNIKLTEQIKLSSLQSVYLVSSVLCLVTVCFSGYFVPLRNFPTHDERTK